MKGKKLLGIISLGLFAAVSVGAGVGLSQKAPVRETKAWSGSDCGTTWYVIGTINGQNWDTWNLLELNEETNRYEYTFEDETTVTFKFANNKTWGNITINAQYLSYADNLDLAGKGWNDYVVDDNSDQHNFVTKEAGKYTIYLNKVNDYASYENGLWEFGIEKELLPPEYHLLGDHNEWEDDDDEYVLTVDSEDSNHYVFNSIDLVKDKKVKVYDSENNIWYGNGVSGDNVTVPETGKYSVDFYVSADNNNHIVLNEKVEYSALVAGQTYTFELDEEDKPEGVKNQYSIAPNYQRRGEEIKFYRNEVQITTGIGADEGEGNNIVCADSKFYFYSEANDGTKIYLKVWNDDGLSVYGLGRTTNEFYATVKDKNGGALNHTLNLDETYKPSGDYIEQYKTSSAVNIYALGGTGWSTSNSLSCGAWSQDINIEAGSDNNAKEAFQTTAWTVHNDCTEVIYLKVKADMSLWLFIGGKEHEHVMTIAGNEIHLEKYEEPGEHLQYRASLSVTAGQTVTSYTIDGVEQTFTSKPIANNNLTEGKKIIVSGNVDVYYDTVDSTLFFSGMDFGGYHMIKNEGTAESTFVKMTAGEPFEEFTQYYLDSISFSVGDTVKFVDTTGNKGSKNYPYATVFAVGKVNAGGLSANFETVDGVIRCKTACNAQVYLKLKSGLDEVYFGLEPEEVAKAIKFAEDFVSEVTEACETVEDSRQEAVETAWSNKATIYKAETFDQKIRNELKKGSSSSVEQIRLFATKYDAIYAKRGASWDLEDFMKWHEPSSRVVSPITESNNSAAAIIVVTVIAVTSISAIAVLLVIKRRKSI